METVQFISITPEKLQESILSGVRNELETLKREFQPKEPVVYLTRNEVRDLLKVDLSTVHNWTKKGKLKAYGISGRIYYKRSEVEAAIQPLS